MARFDADANGAILGLKFSYQSEQSPLQGVPPPGTVYQLQFDESTNAELIIAYQAASLTFAMSGGTLTQNGTPVTVNPPSPFYTAFLTSQEIMSRLGGDMAAVAAAAFRAHGFPV